MNIGCIRSSTKRTYYLSLFMVLVCGHSAAAQDASAAPPDSAVNEANSPLTPKVTVNLLDYFGPSLNRIDGHTANQGSYAG